MMTQIEYAIVGHYPGGLFRQPKPFIRFAGGRSRRKLEIIAQRMNKNGEVICRVRLVKKVFNP